MKVAMVSEHASPLAVLGGPDAGGQNVHVRALASELGSLGCRVVVYTRRDDPFVPRRVGLSTGAVVEHVRAGPAHHVPKDEMLPYMAAFSARLGELWAHDRPDIVHAHFWMSALASLEAARPLGIPVVVTFHALGAVKRRFQGASDTSPGARLDIEAAVAIGADHTIATAREEMGELAAMGADPARMSVVPCGIDPTIFCAKGPSAADEPSARRETVLAIGRLVPRKGVQDVISALAHLPTAQLIVAGGPPAEELTKDPEAERLMGWATELGVSQRVRWLGRQPHDAVPPLMRSASAVVSVPWYEPFGIVPVEAMACGVPVVASSVGGHLDTVVDGKTGLLVPPRAPRALADALGLLFADRSWATQLGAAGAARARDHYSWSHVGEMTLDIYRAVAGRATAGEPVRPVATAATLSGRR